MRIFFAPEMKSFFWGEEAVSLPSGGAKSDPSFFFFFSWGGFFIYMGGGETSMFPNDEPAGHKSPFGGGVGI